MMVWPEYGLVVQLVVVIKTNAGVRYGGVGDIDGEWL